MKKLVRVFFSRYAISAFIILVELLLCAQLVFSAWAYSYVAVLVAAVISLITLVFVINRDANPEYKVSWVIVILALPVFGTILYILFYRRRMTKKEERHLSGLFAEINNHRLGTGNFDMLRRRSPLASGKARAIMNDDTLSEVYTGSNSTFFGDGRRLFESMILDISEAKEFIFLEYFIIDQGVLWSKIHKLLREKAKEGVEIRLLYDDIGCMKTLPSHYEYSLRTEGIITYRFSKVSPSLSSVHNHRDHRKICVIDGKVAYTGGVNIADEYINEKERFGHWKDGGIRVSGEVVRGFIKQFLSMWDFTTHTISDYEKYLSFVEPLKFSDGGYYIPFGTGPIPIYQRPGGKNAFLNLINQSRKYVYITTPYLIIDYELTESLCNAALRGVDVRIITPGIADKKKVKLMTKSAYPYLMRAGVKIYEYTPGFIHEKTFVVDDKYAVVGTINLDYRSLAHNFENALWMYATPTVQVCKDEFLNTVDKSERVDESKSKLTLSERFVRNAIRLFAPLL